MFSTSTAQGFAPCHAAKSAFRLRERSTQPRISAAVLEGANVWDARRILIDAERRAEELYIQGAE